MTADNIFAICNKLKYDMLVNYYKENDLFFIMNTEHIKTIAKSYTPEASLDNIRDCKIMGLSVIHNKYLPMNEILLGIKKDIQL